MKPARKSVVDLAYEINAAAERRERRIKKAYAPAPAPEKKSPNPRAKRAGAKR